MACNFIDLKDVEGDRLGGIKTLPVITGMRRGQQVIGAAFFLCYISIGNLFPDRRMLVFAVITGAVQFVLINRKKYQEWPVFLVYLSSLAVVLLELTR